MSHADRRAERDAAIATMAESIVAVIYAIQADPDEDGSPFSIGHAAAYAAICSLESAGFTVERRRSGKE